MGKFRQAFFGVLHPPAANDVLRLLAVGFPECRLVDPAGLLQHALAEAVGLEHLHGAAGDAIGLAAEQRARLLLDDASGDIGKRRQLRRQGQTGRPAADDEDIDLGRQIAGRSGRTGALRGVRDLGVAGFEAVKMELHETSRVEQVIRLAMRASGDRRIQGWTASASGLGRMAEAGDVAMIEIE